ncbi:MAG: KamA family radical SAM protein [Thermoguttaceae bacterium]|nr:KamA family radical SAM protein [Thermoguttaceae bacterium]
MNRPQELSPLEKILKTRFVPSVGDLLRRLELPASAGSEEAANAFPFLFPESLLNRVSKGNPDDPILKQFLPSASELEIKPGFVEDPLDERTGGDDRVLQKYQGRVLVFATSACAARCRFCFRRCRKARALFPASVGLPIREYLDDALRTLRANPSVREVVFSGGDPLALSNDLLKTLLHYIKSLGTVKRARFHSRVPVLSPKRVDEDFPASDDFNRRDDPNPLALYLVVHVDSPNEIDSSVVKAFAELRRRGYALISQTTLLRGVNDSTEILAELFEKLADARVVPYYLHQLDRAKGTARFEVPVERGLKMMKELAELLPGYAVPKYVREIPGRLSKVNLLAEPDADF